MFKKVLVPTDFSLCAERALEVARENFPQAEIKLLHVVGLDEPPHSVSEALLQLEALSGEVLQGNPAPTIVARATEWGADIIVMGMVGKSGLAQPFFGSVAEAVVHTSPIAVLTVPPPAQPAPHAQPAMDAGKARAVAYHKLLVVVDASECSRQSVAVALRMAELLRAKVLFTHAVYGWELPYTAEVTRLQKEARKQAMEMLEEQVRQAAGQGIEAEAKLEVFDHIPEGIVRATAHEHCDLIVMGTHCRKGLEHWLSGSIAEAVARQAPVPVLLIRYSEGVNPPETIEHILVPTDGSELSMLALDHAKTLATVWGSTLLVLHVLGSHESDYKGYQVLQAAHNRLDHPTVRTQLMPFDGARVGNAIAQLARQEDIDLIVMGTHGRTGLDHLLLGSVAEHVLHKAQLPLLLVRQTGSSPWPLQSSVVTTR